MSIVGTRPPLISETNFYELHHRARLAIKPGITGMWQVSGRSDITDFEEVVRLDKEYITNWNIGLDIKILFKNVYFIIISSTADRLIRTGGQKMTLEEELRFRRMCPYDAFGDYSDVLKEIRQKEKEKKTDTVSVTNPCLGYCIAKILKEVKEHRNTG